MFHLTQAELDFIHSDKTNRELTPEELAEQKRIDDKLQFLHELGSWEKERHSPFVIHLRPLKVTTKNGKLSILKEEPEELK
jgi:hypothetical protein